MDSKEFFERKEPLLQVHAFGLFQLVWAVQHELEIAAEFPCEVCGATGQLTLKTKLEDGSIKDRKEECYYCRGDKTRRDYHHDWTAIGPCQVYNYEASAWPKEKGKAAYKDDPQYKPDDLDHYFYVRYHAYSPFKDEESDSGRLKTLYLHADEIFATEAEARADAERRNKEAREKEK